MRRMFVQTSLHLLALCALLAIGAEFQHGEDDPIGTVHLRRQHHGRQHQPGRRGRYRRSQEENALNPPHVESAGKVRELARLRVKRYYTVNDYSVKRYSVNPPHICIFGDVCKAAYAMTFVCRCPIYQPNCVSSGKYHTARCQNSRGGRVWVQPVVDLHPGHK